MLEAGPLHRALSEVFVVQGRAGAPQERALLASEQSPTTIFEAPPTTR
jgi:hypothetical protein